MKFWKRSPSVLRIALPVRQAAGRGVRVSALVDGRSIWFESADADLAPAAEAFGSLLLIPALHWRRPLEIVPAVCAVWASGVQRIVPLVSGWWGYDPLLPQVAPVAITPRPCRRTALCFSGGVDSFFSLLRGPRPVDLLVCAVGYDVNLRDTRRRTLVEHSVRAVAAELGRRAVLVTSNLRRHRVVRRVPWIRSFGGALAALGHLLSGEAGTLMISAGLQRADDYPSGSRWDVDPWFSSAALKVEHVGAELARTEKLCSIAEEDIVRRHLRVCWENRDSRSNCCRCEKCVRTMLILESCGQLGRYESFGGGGGLSAALDRLAAVPDLVQPVYQALLRRGLSEPYATAVRRLLARSDPARQSPTGP
jgi:hypothetical protein